MLGYQSDPGRTYTRSRSQSLENSCDPLTRNPALYRRRRELTHYEVEVDFAAAS